MDFPASNVRFVDVVSSWAGRIYVGTLFGLVAGFFSASGQVTPGSTPGTLSPGLSVAMLACLVAAGVTAFFLPRAHLLWLLLRNVLLAVVVFILTIVAMLTLGIDSAVGIYASPLLRLLLSTVSALLLAEALTLAVFLLVLIVRGTGGNGKTPEEQVLGDDLDL